MPGCLVVCSRHIERNAVLEDHPVTELWFKGRVSLVVYRREAFSLLYPSLHTRVQLRHEITRALYAFGNMLRRFKGRTTSWHQHLRLQCDDMIKCCRPVGEISIARIWSCLVFNKIS